MIDEVFYFAALFEILRVGLGIIADDDIRIDKRVQVKISFILRFM
ncbi:hypothetical protein [Helicobacter sp.]|nr:hypothetical protein [Helicobacter sp.]